ncbi:glutamate-5-semialdehyde dehydrogenase [Brumicola pallidula]|jgi:glutamate-5-semialdehyde dehydrogenase|uniref:Gamma-glutamyl phosphate reductase n=1 Tax=Brumicola pallidula DSM 14239 = ACAM 615 TaxID=1121922 RepID=K6ZJW3_9ALTE|nr:glutamate-5-semialdehyde dehydrogenase [Glaciecola pallidula]GAC29178.1 glutamate-5-semialdehyde dehydrogenase [Glaciecola pallidula DSM 14239 = ACAM 615]
MSLIKELSQKAAQAAQILSVLDEIVKNAVLLDMAKSLRDNTTGIIEENGKDLVNAKNNSLSDAMIDRLTLDQERIEAMAEGLETVAILPDPVGVERDLGTRPNGLQIRKMRVPLGVVCMIFEARPNVTADAAGLCFKSGNAAILRGGKEALASSLYIANILQNVLQKHDLPRELISVVPNADRALMQELMEQKDYIDVIIPRGGEGLINYVTENSKIPVIQHFKGVCHLYIDKDADIETAINLLVNGKTQRTGVCNALEGLLVHEDIAKEFLSIAGAILEEHSVKVNSCENSSKYFNNATVIKTDGFGEEYLDLEIAVRIVPSVEAAMEHIARFGSNHTEVICTKNELTAKRFQRTVDSSVVMVNASSRFSDGSQLGLGAEIGIATTKLHAYGPMGLESLTTEKYLVNGIGQVRA